MRDFNDQRGSAPSERSLGVIKIVVGIIGALALGSMVHNVVLHDSYSAASRLALFTASIHAYVNPEPYAQKPMLTFSILSVLIVLIMSYFVLFEIIFPPPEKIKSCVGQTVKHTYGWYCEPINGEPYRLTGWGD